MAVWRRKTVPACPHCSRAAGPAFHSKTEAGFTCNGELYVDIESGTTQCLSCAHRGSLEQFTHTCVQCGCEYVGGEVWQGMRTDVARVGNRAWMRRIGVVKGRAEVRITKRPQTTVLFATRTSTAPAVGSGWGCLKSILGVVGVFVSMGLMLAWLVWSRWIAEDIPMGVQAGGMLLFLFLFLFSGKKIFD